ncbi:hypothetical protein [Nonomuraea soli]|uniref:Uncharacterized protein n=1 Tax=Nonomuraea soli TaxID=1032476 RepID=A0A7W0CEN9_9ACTN|nr:hypothetical protein [Nonomuraea soli]MBA2889637.1 hypothetical protein [Nonomuraea soli]
MANNVIDLRRPTGEGCGCAACEKLSFPPVELAADAELAARVPVVPLVADAVALARWTGTRPVGPEAMLPEADAARAVRELGLRPERLRLLWVVAVNTGLLRITRQQAVPGPFTFGKGVEATLEFWDGVVMDVLDRADEGLTGSAVIDEHLAETLATVYSVRTGVSVPVLAKGILQSHEVACGPYKGESILRELTSALELLAYCGLVETTGEPIASGSRIRLTPLGTWAVRQDLRREGHDAPTAAQVRVFAELDASELVAAMVAGGVTPSAVASWLERRSPLEAARALTAIAAYGNAGERGAAGTVLDELGPEAEGPLRAALTEPLLWRYAASWLHIRDLQAPSLTPDDHAWLAVDTLAALLYLSDAPGTLGGLDEDLPGLVAQLPSVDHPDTLAVLDLLASHHDDQVVAKAARKAAMKARSLGPLKL